MVVLTDKLAEALLTQIEEVTRYVREGCTLMDNMNELAGRVIQQSKEVLEFASERTPATQVTTEAVELLRKYVALQEAGSTDEVMSAAV